MPQAKLEVTLQFSESCAAEAASLFLQCRRHILPKAVLQQMNNCTVISKKLRCRKLRQRGAVCTARRTSGATYEKFRGFWCKLVRSCPKICCVWWFPHKGNFWEVRGANSETSPKTPPQTSQKLLHKITLLWILFFFVWKVALSSRFQAPAFRLPRLGPADTSCHCGHNLVQGHVHSSGWNFRSASQNFGLPISLRFFHAFLLHIPPHIYVSQMTVSPQTREKKRHIKQQ